MITKKDNGTYFVDIRPAGRNGPRFRKSFPNRAEAVAFERWAQSKHSNPDTPWEKKTKDTRRLCDIADDWHKYHGHTLTSGDKRLQQLKATAKELNNPLATNIEPTAFLEYRKKRLADGVTENHLNHELTYLKSAFNELIAINNWNGENPYQKIKKLKVPAKELSFLTKEQIDQLFASLDEARNPDVKIVVEICLSIGCRYGEANELTARQIHNGKIHLTKTKTNNPRSIPIKDELAKKILDGRPKQGRLFRSCWDAFEEAIKRAGIETPKGQMTHILRHTYASHFMIKGGDLLKLNKILGHKTIQMTMVYSHLAPDHLTDAMVYGPLD